MSFRDTSERKQTEAELQARHAELEILYDINRSILVSADLKAALEQILEKALSVSNCDMGAIRLTDEHLYIGPAIMRGYRNLQRAHTHGDREGRADTETFTQAMRERKAFVVEDLAQVSGMRTFKREGAHSAIVVPVQTEDEVLGIINLGARSPRKFAPETIRMLEAIGNQVGIAVQKAKLHDETKRRSQQQEAVNKITLAVSASLDIEEVLKIALDKVLETTGRERGYIRLRDTSTGKMTLSAYRGISEEYARMLRERATPEGKSAKTFTSGEPLVINDVDQAEVRDETRREGIKAIGWFPLKARGEVVGVLNVATEIQKPFTAEEVAFLQSIGNVIGVALENARLFDQTKRSSEQLAKQAQELARSNAELEQFAYVASHDLQEPLRMVESYVKLLARRYQDKLDADANEFIAYAADGATRMRKLINDLLEYSRVSSKGKEFEPTECKAAFDQALANLATAISESQAIVTCGPLPVVRADGTQLARLLQNLIGNAVKFRTETAPRVHVAAEKDGTEWRFSVRDNGIGFDPQFADKIFTIFQRLHSRAEYPGTGIGLAVCKKIVERHGGRIWVESKPGSGSTFYFTLPGATTEEVTPHAPQPRPAD